VELIGAAIAGGVRKKDNRDRGIEDSRTRLLGSQTLDFARFGIRAGKGFVWFLFFRAQSSRHSARRPNGA